MKFVKFVSHTCLRHSHVASMLLAYIIPISISYQHVIFKRRKRFVTLKRRRKYVRRFTSSYTQPYVRAAKYQVLTAHTDGIRERARGIRELGVSRSDH